VSFYADGMKVRDKNGKPVCVTTFSHHLDPDSGIYNVTVEREAMAQRIAVALTLLEKMEAKIQRRQTS